jgi:hypothetical protein
MDTRLGYKSSHVPVSDLAAAVYDVSSPSFRLSEFAILLSNALPISERIISGSESQAVMQQRAMWETTVIEGGEGKNRHFRGQHGRAGGGQAFTVAGGANCICVSS